MDTTIKKQFNKKRFVFLIIAVIMFSGAMITFQNGWVKTGNNMMGSNIGSVCFSGNTLYYGSRWHGICAYDEETATDRIIIKNANDFFQMEDEYIYYRKGNKDYKYNIHIGKSEKSEKLNEEFYYTGGGPTLEIREVLRNDENIPGDISYAIINEKYFYARHSRFGGYIGVYNVEDGKVVMGVDGEYGKILEHSYSPIGMFMSGVGAGNINASSPTNIIWILFMLLPMPFFILGIVFVKKWKRLKNN